ncbi:LOW QUALITY PROTEIN: RUN and FYVE domain-containing protein 2-like [Paramacrobiotus metropolitanus]|uniref:LOW QUALITY PROTEIN: RUN and FYVE domain-containing protein 2-like n=1 Tax=Paramacrobiotus metropolitanus TaxID=2943436 RepID=UPI002445D3F7|nr:LOW QUALITY PROTEIN: RUN and FYVE domain-containing protein 2-like [Paramacrobiotus metropolitanus]
MSDQGQSVSPSLYAALTSPITKTFAEQRKHLVHVPRGFSLDILPDFMLPVQNDARQRSEAEAGDKTMEIERKNMLGLTQLIVKDVIETSMPLDRTVTGQFQPLQHLFSILEQILKHGFRPKPKGLLSSRTKDIWNILESLETVCPQSKEVTESCRNLSHIETPMGKVRAWIRLSLMQKKLPDYFKVLVDHRDSLLADCYENGAMLMNDESSVVAGLLVGLNFIDYNLCVKDEDLDRDFQMICLLPYLKTRSQPAQEPPASDGEMGLKAILDQKNYLEELNAHLKYQLDNLESKCETLTTSNTKLSTELEDARKLANTAQLENQDLKLVNERIQKTGRDDNSGEASRAGFDPSNSSGVQLKLERELALKQDLERELKLQTNIRMETEAAMKLMERDIQEKEELLSVWRKQLDDLKLVNLEMYQKLQTAENALKHKSDLVARMEQKMQQMGDTMLQLGNRIQILDSERRAAEETARKLSMQLAETDVTRSVLETDLRMEQEQKANLMGSLTEQQNELQKLQGEIQSIRNISQSYEKLRNEHDVLQQMSHEQEETLAELSTHLSEQKVKVAEMKEVTSQLDPTASQWEKDATSCKLCEKPFTVARRKHHCRHCGGTFCNPCSDNKMSLPSSPKPVRVCDNCHILLLRRYSAK